MRNEAYVFVVMEVLKKGKDILPDVTQHGISINRGNFILSTQGREQ